MVEEKKTGWLGNGKMKKQLETKKLIQMAYDVYDSTEVDEEFMKKHQKKQ